MVLKIYGTAPRPVCTAVCSLTFAQVFPCPQYGIVQIVQSGWTPNLSQCTRQIAVVCKELNMPYEVIPVDIFM